MIHSWCSGPFHFGLGKRGKKREGLGGYYGLEVTF